jgi:hypothetical protein
MPNPAYEILKGRNVWFRAGDIHLPEPAEVLHELHSGEILEGRVVDVSDSGPDGRAFVVIQVDRLRQPCILAVERILPAVDA